MHPTLLTLGGVAVPSYAVFVALGLVVAWRIRRGEVARLGYEATPGHAWVGLGALVGAALGSKLGMLLYAADFADMWARMLDWDFTGKTVVGGIGGGWLGVEVTKRLVGVRRSTGDAFAVALPVAQAFGRVGCLLHGCCPGVPYEGPGAVLVGGVWRMPTPLFEAAGDLALGALLWSLRRTPRPAGVLFRYYILGYALLRLGTEFARDDAQVRLGGLSSVQWVCLATALGLGGWLWALRRQAGAGWGAAPTG